MPELVNGCSSRTAAVASPATAPMSKPNSPTVPFPSTRMIQRSAPSHIRTRFLPTPRDLAILQAVRTHTRLTANQVRRLFFRGPGDRLKAPQTVSARLRRLVAYGYLESLVADRGHGAGPHAYGLGPRAHSLFPRAAVRRLRGPGPVLHQLEVAEFRVRLEETLRGRDGELVEWIGEPTLRSLGRTQRRWPVPDALVHWCLRDREGTFLLEWDRGTESLAILSAKLERYAVYHRDRGYRRWLPGLGLRPRLAVVTTSARAVRLVRLVRNQKHRSTLTIAIAPVEAALRDPLAATWWRSDLSGAASLFA